MPRMKPAKPPSGVWMVSQRAGRSPSVAKAWATPGGGRRTRRGDCDRSAFASDLEGQFALEHVECVGVLVVHVGPATC